jgi:alcohol dehydrogenase
MTGVRAVVFHDIGEVRVTDVADPAIQEPDDAIVRVGRTAICGSDLHFFHGKAPIDPGEVLGHEAVGVVEAVGADVTGVQIGDRVVVAFDIACGRCWFCRRGQSQLCDDFRNLGAGAFGGGLPGAQAELVRVPAADVNLLSVPDALNDERALFVGDVLTTGLYGASLADPEPDDVVAVVGCGPVGFFCIQAVRQLGVERVYAVDPEPSRLALAAALGAVPVDPRKRHPQTVLAEATDGRGADVVLEAVGATQAFESAVGLVRRGGRVVVVGMYAGESVEVQLGVYWARALSIRFAGVCPVHAWWRRAMEAVADGRMDPSPIVSHRLPLDDAPLGYELFDRREATKVVLVP